MKTKYLNLALVFCLVLGSLLTAYPAYAQTTVWPPDSFWNEPQVPSIFDGVSFGLYDYPPPEWTCHWNFGDGTTYNECWVNASKYYRADGDYTVSVMVTNEFGETVTPSRVVSVRTHDVAITRFTVPQSAKAGQTRQITVEVRNTRYLERIQVELYKNDIVYPPIGTLTQDVPPRSANRTTAFSFTYTFTAEDARIGKVTFRAMAFILDNGGDDWQVDNTAIALPTRVSR
jgi:hypothetical protein